MNADHSQPIILSFDGNIGSGKSSIIKYFQDNFKSFCDKIGENLKICFLEEPVATWETIIDQYDGKNIIQKYYENNERYSFAFQMMAYISRLSQFRKALKGNYDIIITERSMYTDRNVFAKMLHDSLKMSDIEFTIYNKWFNEFTDCTNNIKHIYVRTTPEICEQRILKRDRKGEKNIYPAYLANCHLYHDAWLNKKSNNILIVDGTININTCEQKNMVYDMLMEKVYNFMLNRHTQTIQPTENYLCY